MATYMNMLSTITTVTNQINSYKQGTKELYSNWQLMFISYIYIYIYIFIEEKDLFLRSIYFVLSLD